MADPTLDELREQYHRSDLAQQGIPFQDAMANPAILIGLQGAAREHRERRFAPPPQAYRLARPATAAPANFQLIGD